ncbi:MAG: tetratricopeptide repeat protein [Myxococcota bacterium]|nr:tetratricopeptide repeat protein [Myxococcota bacterium]
MTGLVVSVTMMVGCAHRSQTAQQPAMQSVSAQPTAHCEIATAHPRTRLQQSGCVRAAMFKHRQHQTLITQLTKRRDAMPNDGFHWLTLGLAQLGLNPKTAMETWGACLRQRAADPWCLYGQAVGEVHQGRWTRALDRIQRARASELEQPEFGALEVRIRLALGETSRADMLLARLDKTDPNAIAVIDAHVQLSLHKGSAAEARHKILALLDRQPNSARPRLLAARLAAKLGDGAGTARYLQEALACNVHSAHARLKLARALVALDRHVTAIDHLSQLCKEDDFTSTACFELGEAHLASGAPSRALGWADKLLKQSNQPLAVHGLRARALIALGRYDAARALRPLLYADPLSSLKYRLMMANALGDAGARGYAEEEFTETLRAFPNLPEGWAAYGQWYHKTGELHRAEAVLREGLNRLPKAAILHANLGHIFELQSHRELAIKALRRSLRLAPDDHQVADQLAFLEFSVGMRVRAIGRWESIVRAGLPTDQVLQRLSLAYGLADQSSQAAQIYEELVERHPARPEYLTRLAEYYLKAERPEDAIQMLDKKHPELTGDRKAQALLATALSAAGQHDRADGLFKDALQGDPSNRPLRLTYAAFRERLGDARGAHAMYRAQLARNPEDPAALAGLRRTDEDVAAEHREQSPYPATQVDPELRQLSRAIGELGPEDVGTVLRDERYVEVDEEGIKTIRHQRSVLIRRSTGVERYQEVKIGFHSQHPPRIDRARTITPDGKIIPIETKSLRVENPHEGTPLYGDSRHLVLTFREVESGAIVDYDVTTFRPHPEVRSAWWDSYILGNADPTIWALYELSVNHGTVIHHTTPGLDTPHIRHEGHREVLSWSRRALPGYRHGNTSSNRIPSVYISSMSDWQAVDRWYDTLFKSRALMSDDIRREAQRIMQAHHTDEGRIGAVLRLVEERIEYLGIEFGIGAYQPRPATSTLTQRKGDCKDMTALMVALLRAMEITAYPMLIKPADQGSILADHPSPGQFSHVILYVPRPGKDLWLDGTANLGTLNALPEALRGQLGFAVDGQGGRLIRIPTAQPKDHRLDERRVYNLTSTGGGDVDSNIRLSGDLAGRSRQRLSGIVSEARGAFLSAPGFLLGHGLIPHNIDIERMTAPSQPLTIRVKARHRDLVAVRLDGSLVLSSDLDIFSNGLLAAPGAAIELETPRTVARTIVVNAPPGYRFDWKPISISIPGPLQLEVSEKRGASKTVITTRLTFALRAKTASGLQGLQRSLARIRSALTEDLVIKPGPDFNQVDFLRAISVERPADTSILFHLGRALIMDDQLKEAAVVLERARQLNRRDPQVLALLTALHLKMENESGAVETMRDILSTEMARPRIVTTLAQMLRAQGKSMEAHRVLDAGRRSFPEDRSLRIHFIHSLLGHEKYDEALREAELIASTAPDNVDVQRLLADIAVRANDIVTARSAYRRILALHPTDLPSLNNLAWALRHSEDGRIEGILLAEKAVSVAPELPAAWETLAELYFIDGQWLRASAAMDRAMTLETSPTQQQLNRHQLMKQRVRQVRQTGAN